jgi:glyoxylase I family protein
MGTRLNIAKKAIDLGIITRNPQAMLEFYRDLLGLPIEGTIDMPGGGVMHRLKAGDSIVKIVDAAPPPKADAIPGGLRAATGYRYWTIHVTNLDEALTAIARAGCRIPVPAKEIRKGVTIAMVEDPDGNWVEILQNS